MEQLLEKEQRLRLEAEKGKRILEAELKELRDLLEQKNVKIEELNVYIQKNQETLMSLNLK